MYDTANTKSQPCVDLTHPVSVTLCQIIVDGNYVYALSFKRVKIDGKSSHEGLTFTGLHLGDPPLMDRDTADYLHPVVLHLENSPCGLSADCKSIRQDVVQRLAFSQTSLELRRHSPEFIVVHGLVLFVQRHDFVGDLVKLLYFFSVNVPKKFFK